jgi:hypothetical protein
MIDKTLTTSILFCFEKQNCWASQCSMVNQTSNILNLYIYEMKQNSNVNHLNVDPWNNGGSEWDL